MARLERRSIGLGGLPMNRMFVLLLTMFFNVVKGEAIVGDNVAETTNGFTISFFFKCIKDQKVMFWLCCIGFIITLGLFIYGSTTGDKYFPIASAFVAIMYLVVTLYFAYKLDYLDWLSKCFEGVRHESCG